MSNDTSVQAIVAMRAGGDGTTEVKLPPTSAPLPPAERAPAALPITNPTLRLDVALGLVVIEFRNDSGAITTSIPSQQQLAAYQRWNVTRFGPTPAGLRAPSVRTVAPSGIESHELASAAKGSGLGPAAPGTAPVGKPHEPPQ